MKGGMLPIFLMLHLVLPWLCLASPALASENGDAVVALKDYPQVKFSTASATPETYRSFIASVRAALVSKSKGNKSNGIPVLLSEDDPLALQTFLNITLTNTAGHSVSLKMDVTGAYFSAYDALKYSCLLKRSGRTFSSAICYNDPWSSGSVGNKLLQSSSSDSLPAAAGGVASDDLEAATWRAKDLDDAVSSLFLFATGKATKEDLSRGVATCDMMIAGAAMSPYVERRMSAGVRSSNGVPDDPSLHGLQARWPALSAAVQGSHQGVFAAPVSVQLRDGNWMPVDNVRRVVPLLSFLLHDSCKKASSPKPVIRSVAQEPDMGGGGAPACAEAEPTVRIAGTEGRCVTVPNGWYYNGNQVQVWPCKSNGDADQLWTFKRDGTVRSNGMCLTSTGTSPGDKVVVWDCPRAPTDGVVWEARVDGAIALRASGSSGLVLAAAASTIFTGLTVQRDDRSSVQSWTPTNYTAPLATAVVGPGDLCLQAASGIRGPASVAACHDGAWWFLYPDGSVRSRTRFFLRQWWCLTADAAGRAVVSFCATAGSPRQRWAFRNDGSVLNAGAGSVLDVRASGGGGQSGGWEVVVSPATGSPTQEWAIML
ncbi:hypothetical protein PAHAL_2G081000 [Panicum hallii]|jgi:hypothetical protein|uniref:Ribosome-inactivating protein n=1 Tax=Panicum hallii TaxID=206008 RepID=A0A2S3GX75_9POAL|nr:ricin-like [Panicum hallii]XP_025803187.1 ricin-like [Panicum hallii]XP_025803188.1 ricin-like [Panicum hallii]XP_025803189.1 ricin-like [Panicum hallii]XP_025803190.1 ricin-like [Panicum hallii]XP_025803191.1 ricin-like [Panicum hallii]XP_025803192.1 ricin-like [Panicum hallii]XP_025803193.1 ricin-like [Panicum hallii]XP_025803194.1 ricin-like [Panicum hallii]XP_025803195.1 ricin-like [Panicum hallii]PAN10240.1 hypothetical protein PAHAL_2G081000 [Panicum hallii]PAN10241.1 hypothetic